MIPNLLASSAVIKLSLSTALFISSIFFPVFVDKILFKDFFIFSIHSANTIIAQLLFLASKKSKNENISIHKGEVNAAMAILDTMNHIKSDVRTLSVGQAASAAAVILSCGTKGKRSALRNAEIMVHQPHGGVEGQTTDVAIAAKRMENMKKSLNKILSTNTGKKIEEINKAVERDNFMTAEEARRFGIIDVVAKIVEAS